MLRIFIWPGAYFRAVVIMEIKPGRYRHFKGNDYEVIGVATHSESGEKLVVYRDLWKNRELWVRPLEMFVEMVDGKPRFGYIGD